MDKPILFNLSALCATPIVTEVKKTIPKRCECTGCKSRLMLTDIRCKCEKYFCMTHRFADNHKCEYDYKSMGIDNLKKQLIQVNGEKIEKI